MLCVSESLTEETDDIDNGLQLSTVVYWFK